MDKETPSPIPSSWAKNRNESDLDGIASPRRSGRCRISTTMQIQGHTVLRKNNYKVTGMQYLFDVHDEDAPKQPSKKKPKIAQQKHQGQPREENPATVKRRKHNQFVDESITRKSKFRIDFLAQRLDLLRPFLEDSVVDYLATFQDSDIYSSTSAISSSGKKTVNQPKMIERATLRPYQLKGLDFMVRMHEKNLAMILGDEMGLGKTIQTISLICHLKEEENLTGPSLIVCPLTVLSSWCNEMKNWAPSLKFFMLHASNTDEQLRQRRFLSDNATEFDVILTTYEMTKAPALLNFFQRTKFHYLVLDEGHKIKSHETMVSKMMRKVHAGNKLLLTGTPLQNNLVELWSLLNFLYPDIFTTCAPFEKHFDLGENIIDKAFLAKAQKMLEVFMLRRLKEEVEKLIPEKLETKVYCPLSKVQTFWYKALLLKDVTSLAKMESSGGSTKFNLTLLRSLFMQLRKCSNHPFVFDGAEGNPSETSLEDLMGASGKLAVLDMLLRSLYQKGHRAVLFSQFTMVLDVIEDYCNLRGWKICRLDGATDRARRNYYVRRFNEQNSDIFLFIMTTRSGGMGLNLQTADTCIIFDSDWNPQSDNQAMARVHRIGQEKTVHVYRLVTAGTIEERLIERAEKKLLLEMVNQESKNTNAENDPEDVARGLSATELWEDIKFGCEAVFGNSAENKLPSEKDIDDITNRARKESDSVGNLTGGTRLTAKSFDEKKKFSETQFFGGANFRELRKQHETKEKKRIPKNLRGIAYLWNEIKNLENKKRERKSRICQIAGEGSGYGKKFVPVLAANNYTLGGESSVFERELKQSNKSDFEVRKRKNGPPFEHLDYCVVCGDGGALVCCPRCPNTVHLSCVGLKKSRDFRCCPQHQCSKCGKKRDAAGGLLYPCHACVHAFCEDCLPSTGVTFLGAVDRFDALGFDSSKNNVYINCSCECEVYAKQEFGYVPPLGKKARDFSECPKAMDLSRHFGASYDISNSAPAVNPSKENGTGPGKRNVPRKNYSMGRSPKTPETSVTKQLTKNQPFSNIKGTPVTSATDLSSDTSSYCSVINNVLPDSAHEFIGEGEGEDVLTSIQIEEKIMTIKSSCKHHQVPPDTLQHLDRFMKAFRQNAASSM